MNGKASYLVIFFLIPVLCIPKFTHALDINKTLSNYPQFGAFNGLLSQTGLLDTIDRRSTITILALDNATLSSIQGRDKDQIKKILSTHVILDYYDVNKLKNIPNDNIVLTTLFQSSGQARSGQGFLNVTRLSSGDIVFGSNVKNGSLVAKLLKSVYSQPFNISILHVSLPIVPPGVGDVISAPPPPPYSPPPAASPKSPKTADSDDVDGDDSPSSESDPPSSDDPAEAPAPSSKAKPPAKEDEGVKDGNRSDHTAKSWASARVSGSVAPVVVVVGIFIGLALGLVSL